MAMAVGMPASPWLSCSTAGVSMVGVPVLGASAAFAVDSVVRHLEARLACSMSEPSATAWAWMWRLAGPPGGKPSSNLRVRWLAMASRLVQAEEDAAHIAAEWPPGRRWLMPAARGEADRAHVERGGSRRSGAKPSWDMKVEETAVVDVVGGRPPPAKSTARRWLADWVSLERGPGAFPATVAYALRARPRR
jgi:hypothetical protein